MLVIETNRLQLRRLTLEDAPALHQILSDPDTMRFYPAPYDMDGTLSWIERSISSYQKNGFGLLAVILKNTNQLIGQCGISLQYINEETVPEIGYHIGKTHWNNGYATEAAQGCLTYGFETLGLDCLYIHTYIKNLPSQRVAEKLGMKKIGEYEKPLKSHKLSWTHVVYRIPKYQ